MRFWSKGLGERELVIDLSRGNLTNEEGKVFMRGIIVEPVNWHYEVTLFPEDVRGILRVMVSLQAMIYLFKNLPQLLVFFSRCIKRDFGSDIPAEAKPGQTRTPEERTPEKTKA